MQEELKIPEDTFCPLLPNSKKNKRATKNNIARQMKCNKFLFEDKSQNKPKPVIKLSVQNSEFKVMSPPGAIMNPYWTSQMGYLFKHSLCPFTSWTLMSGTYRSESPTLVLMFCSGVLNLWRKCDISGPWCILHIMLPKHCIRIDLRIGLYIILLVQLHCWKWKKKERLTSELNAFL